MPEEIVRDRWGRPLIDGTPYTRISTLAKALSDSTGLTKWKMRRVAQGLAKRSDLLALAASASSDADLGAIAERAMEAAEASSKANIGTALHSFTEMVDDGLSPLIPDEFKPTIAAYQQAMSGLKIVAMERFVVVDQLQAAGTFDRLVQLPDGRIVVADIKTGQGEPKYPLSACIQIACYSRGNIYHPERGRLGTLAAAGVDQKTGLLIHLPAGKAKCDLYLLDLSKGWLAAERAVWVRAANKDKSIIKQYS